MFTLDQKRVLINIFKALVKRFKQNEDFLSRFITVDETWLYNYSPETKEQSKQWITKSESASKKGKILSSTKKVMAIVFWDSHSIFFINYLEKCKTITGKYYASLHDQLMQKLHKKTAAFEQE